MKLRTQYAKKTAATCQAVAAGWQDVTNNSALAYSAAGPNNGTAIAAMANNPGLPPTSVGHSYQSIVRPGSAAQLMVGVVTFQYHLLALDVVGQFPQPLRDRKSVV